MFLLAFTPPWGRSISSKRKSEFYMSLLEVNDLSKTYNKSIQALDHISFHVNEGESLGIVGESGSGKAH